MAEFLSLSATIAGSIVNGNITGSALDNFETLRSEMYEVVDGIEYRYEVSALPVTVSAIAVNLTEQIDNLYNYTANSSAINASVYEITINRTESDTSISDPKELHTYFKKNDVNQGGVNNSTPGTSIITISGAAALNDKWSIWVENFRRIDLIDIIWDETKGMSKSIQQLNNTIAHIFLGADIKTGVYPYLGAGSQPTGSAIINGSVLAIEDRLKTDSSNLNNTLDINASNLNNTLDINASSLNITMDRDNDESIIIMREIERGIKEIGVRMDASTKKSDVLIGRTLDRLPLDSTHLEAALNPYPDLKSAAEKAEISDIDSTLYRNIEPYIINDSTILNGVEGDTSGILNSALIATGVPNNLEISHLNGLLLTGSSQTIPSINGIINIDASSNITLTPDINYSGPIFFSYRLDDPIEEGTTTGVAAGIITAAI